MLWIIVGTLIVVVALLVFYVQNQDEQRRLDISILQLEVKILTRKMEEYHPDTSDPLFGMKLEDDNKNS